MFSIEENLKKLPDKPGVYLHRNNLGEVIYVGKAVSLKNRVRQYFQSSNNKDPKRKALSEAISEFEYIVCGSESEALILENNLIKEYMPKYNVLLRDDKTYPYIKITKEAFPRIIKTREVLKDGGEYYGPYSSAGAVNDMIHVLNKVYKLKQCSLNSFPKGFRPCLNHFIGNCHGICIKAIDRVEYLKSIDMAREFLKGKSMALEVYLKDKMMEASNEMRYEEAAKFRDYLKSAKDIEEVQRVTISQSRDMDLVLWGGKGNMVVFFVRNGKLVERETFSVDNYGDFFGNKEAIVESFIKQFYFSKTYGPKEIILAKDIEEKEFIEVELSKLWNKKVVISVPKRGEKKALLDLAQADIMQFAKAIEEKAKAKVEREANIRNELLKIIGDIKGFERGAFENKKNLRIESYDISNTNGLDTVGAMVVFNGINPEKKAYRRFKLKGDYGGDDYGAMTEVIYRRLKRAEEGDESFLPLPDLILLDGGKGHLSTIRELLLAMDLKIAMAGMAKDDFHRTKALVYEREDGIVEKELKNRSLLFSYMGKIQEEVHRFAITYHRGLRDKGKIKTILEDIPNIGAKKSSKLLVYFGSVEKIKSATEDELLKVPSITKKDCENIKEFFKNQG